MFREFLLFALDYPNGYGYLFRCLPSMGYVDGESPTKPETGDGGQALLPDVYLMLY